jgi:hypothetical protein
MGEMRNAYKILVGKPEGKIPLGITRRGLEDNITVDLREIGARERTMAGSCEHGNEPSGFIKTGKFLDQ